MGVTFLRHKALMDPKAEAKMAEILPVDIHLTGDVVPDFPQLLDLSPSGLLMADRGVIAFLLRWLLRRY